jgi:hypothetical protein
MPAGGAAVGRTRPDRDETVVALERGAADQAIQEELKPVVGRKATNDRLNTNFELDELLHPAQAFDHPSDVVDDPDLTLNEKRAILAAWASDACAIEAAPELRASPRGAPVRFDDIMEALRLLDKQAHGLRHYGTKHRRRALTRSRRTGESGAGTPLQ